MPHIKLDPNIIVYKFCSVHGLNDETSRPRPTTHKTRRVRTEIWASLHRPYAEDFLPQTTRRLAETRHYPIREYFAAPRR